VDSDLIGQIAASRNDWYRDIQLPPEPVTEEQVVRVSELSNQLFNIEKPVDGFLLGPASVPDGRGIRIAVDGNQEIRSVAPGVILSVEWTLSSGFVIVQQHINGYVSVYKNLTDVTVKPGNIVSSIMPVGSVSQPQGVDRPYLHYELW